VSYGIGDATARGTGHTHGRRAAAEDTYVLREAKRTTSTLHRSTAEAALGYDHEAERNRDAQRTQTGTRTGRHAAAEDTLRVP
jgi:hypothetical protein